MYHVCIGVYMQVYACICVWFCIYSYIICGFACMIVHVYTCVSFVCIELHVLAL